MVVSRVKAHILRFRLLCAQLHSYINVQTPGSLILPRFRTAAIFTISLCLCALFRQIDELWNSSKPKCGGPHRVGMLRPSMCSDYRGWFEHSSLCQGCTLLGSGHTQHGRSTLLLAVQAQVHNFLGPMIPFQMGEARGNRTSNPRTLERRRVRRCRAFYTPSQYHNGYWGQQGVWAGCAI
jgi:hypothetical protein